MWRAEKGYLLPHAKEDEKKDVYVSPYRQCLPMSRQQKQHHQWSASVSSLVGILRLLLLMMWTSSADVCGDGTTAMVDGRPRLSQFRRIRRRGGMIIPRRVDGHQTRESRRYVYVRVYLHWSR